MSFEQESWKEESKDEVNKKICLKILNLDLSWSEKKNKGTQSSGKMNEKDCLGWNFYFSQSVPLIEKNVFLAENLSFLEEAAIIEQKNPKDVRESNERNNLWISTTEYKDMNIA